jgi:hypothetical protein
MPEFDHDEDQDLDASFVACPHCGCNDTEVLRMPRPDRWFDRVGVGECHHCGRRFSIDVVAEPPEPPREESTWQWLVDAIARAKAELLR